MKHFILSRSALATTMSLALSLVACGGGGDAAPSTPHLTGTAAVGAALAGANVTARCAAGPDITGTTGSDGEFDLSLASGQALPCMVRVTGGSPRDTSQSGDGKWPHQHHALDGAHRGTCSRADASVLV